MKIQHMIVTGLVALCPVVNALHAQESGMDTLKKEKNQTMLSGFKDWAVWKKFVRSNDNLRNIDDTLVNELSISFVPSISSNRMLSINTVNNYSINILAGYSKGVEVMEIGGLVNVDNGDVHYVQAAGLCNVVTGEVTGAQLAGLANINGKSTTGLQGSGWGNVVTGNFSGIQGAGFANFTRDTTSGIQSAGFANFTGGPLYGLQSAGFLNVTLKEIKGLQLAGFGNYTNQMNGIQGAGFFNYTHTTMNGIQAAGFVNSADTLNGIQAAGFINRAKHFNGFQIGVINVARSCNGIPIGWFSYVHTGYHKLELATDERLFTTFAFRTGVDKFHNIFFAGSNFSKDQRYLTYGYGLGSAIQLREKWYVDIDLTAQTFQKPNFSQGNFNLVNKLFAGAEFRPVPKISIAAGPTLNVWVANINDPGYGDLSQTIPAYSFFSTVEKNTQVKAWIGAKISVKFL